MLDGITITDAVSQLSDANAEVRYRAAWVLQYIGDDSVVDALLVTIEDADMRVRVASAQALGRIGDGRAVDALLKLMQHAAAEERYVAAVALGRIESRNLSTAKAQSSQSRKREEVIEALRVAMRDDDVFVRCGAGLSLAAIGGFTIAPKVLDALSREKVSLREAAARQVEKLITRN